MIKSEDASLTEQVGELFEEIGLKPKIEFSPGDRKDKEKLQPVRVRLSSVCLSSSITAALIKS